MYQTIMNFYIISIITFLSLISTVYAKEFENDAIKITNSGTEFNLILNLETNEDIYGIQFNLDYNQNEISTVRDSINSMIGFASLYALFDQKPKVNIIMMNLDGDSFIKTSNYKANINILSIIFKVDSLFKGISKVKLNNLIIVGKAGKVIPVQESSYEFDLSYNLPKETLIKQNIPNPFNIETYIDYEIAHSTNVYIGVYDLQGNINKILVNEFQNANYYSISWDGRDGKGDFVKNGRYILKFETDHYTDTITVMFIK